jgi:hypothetical protein
MRSSHPIRSLYQPTRKDWATQPTNQWCQIDQSGRDADARRKSIPILEASRLEDTYLVKDLNSLPLADEFLGVRSWETQESISC